MRTAVGAVPRYVRAVAFCSTVIRSRRSAAFGWRIRRGTAQRDGGSAPWGDHFWPAMYPGIRIVGFLVGLGGGNIISTILGTIGGLIGAVALYFVFTWLGLEETILSLVGLIGGALAGSYLLTGLGSRIEGLRSRSAK